MKNPLKETLRAGGVCFGTSCMSRSTFLAEALAKVGFDFIFFDTEHSPNEVGDIMPMLQAINYQTRTVPVVRVAWNDMVLIKRALDIGSYGVIIPWVSNREQAQYAVRACRYPQSGGVRGFGPMRPMLHDPDYVKTADQEIVIACQIETQEAVDKIEEICSVDGVNVTMIGPADLSMSLGVFQQYRSEKFVNAIQKVIDVSKAHGVYPGAFSFWDVEDHVKAGHRFMITGGDSAYVQQGARAMIDRARKAEATLKPS